MEDPAVKGALVALGLMAVVPLMLLGGVVCADLWAWFLVPLGVPAIGVAHAIGIHSLIGLMTVSISRADLRAKSESTDVIARCGDRALGYLLVWAVGAIVASCM